MPLANVDWFLEEVLDMAAAGLVPAVTLLVGGTLVAGIPVSEMEYFTGVGASLRDELAAHERTETAEGLSEMYRAYGQAAEDDRKRRRDRARALAARLREELPEGEALSQETPAEVARSYVLLKDATIHGPGGERFQASFWRGRLAEVDGWSFGRP